MKSIQTLLFISFTFLSLSTSLFSANVPAAKSWGSFVSSIEAEVEHLAQEAVVVAEEIEEIAIEVAPTVVPVVIELLTGAPINLTSAASILTTLSTINTHHPEVLQTLQTAVTDHTGLSMNTQNAALSTLQEAGVILEDGQITTPEVAQFIAQALAFNKQTGKIFVRSLGEIQQDAIRQRSFGSIITHAIEEAEEMITNAVTAFEETIAEVFSDEEIIDGE